MADTRDWQTRNQEHLVREVARVRALVEGAAAPKADPIVRGDDEDSTFALDTLHELFDLTPFERDIVLLCAGVELDAAFAASVAAAQGDTANRSPTFGLALARLPNPHWSAITPARPLRAWRIVELVGAGLTSAALRIDERILNFLAGAPHLDERLQGVISPFAARQAELPSHKAVAAQVAAHLRNADGDERPSIAQIIGPDHSERVSIAASTCAALDVNGLLIDGSDIPAGAAERFTLGRALTREALLSRAVVVVDVASGVDDARVERFVTALSAPVIVNIAEALPELVKKSPAFETPVTPSIARIASPNGRAPKPRMQGLAQRIEVIAGWDDIVLPEPQRRVLRSIVSHARQRQRVYHDWGFASKSNRGLGIAALFAGPSGTGKTMAAEVLAGELHRDLYRIDLASVVSKYIGETEKNLKQVFDNAEETEAILLFDEADALFGKRSEVKDSHDRYANIEVSYLLQRMEAYRGLAILTTNMKSSIDSAFMRRLRFIVNFPFPDAEQRAEIWRSTFPSRIRTADFEWDRLAQLNVAGGQIRNIALGAAFLAADRNEEIAMHHLAESAHTEYAKLERTPTTAETRGWAGGAG